MSIDFVLNTQIENIGQNQPPKLISFLEILHTAVQTSMKYEVNMVKRNYTFALKIWFYKLISKVQIDLASSGLGKNQN